MMKFDPKPWEELREYMKQFGDWRKKNHFGTADYTSDRVFLAPLTLYLIKSQEKSEKLTKILIVLTIILAILTGISIYSYFV